MLQRRAFSSERMMSDIYDPTAAALFFALAALLAVGGLVAYFGLRYNSASSYAGLAATVLTLVGIGWALVP
jgi:hypothetical protein